MEARAIGGHSHRLTRHVIVLVIAAALALVVTHPRVQASGPGGFSGAVQIDAVIEQPSVVPLMLTRPAQTVVVSAGQTVEELARSHAGDAAAIRWANHIPWLGEPAPGTPVLIPPGPGALVQVDQGETPTSFAQRVHLQPSTILDFNVLTSNAPLPGGTYLQIPLAVAPVGALIGDRFVMGGFDLPAVVPDHGRDNFPYGQCTWYVATRRDVLWGGDAWTWWYAARGIRPEGHVPVAGAIAVFHGGWAGHVAYVESVNPNGSFVVAEMNFYGDGGGWGRVDRRVIPATDRLLTGFIY